MAVVEVYVGWPTVEAIVTNKVAPGMLDHYLARTGYDSQQTSEPEDSNPPNNLWKPVGGDHRAHGVFGELAKSVSFQSWANLHRLPLALTAFIALFLQL